MSSNFIELSLLTCLVLLCVFYFISWLLSIAVAANPDASDSIDGQVYSFECHLAGRQLSRGEPTVYERVSVSGTFRGPRRRREWADKSERTKHKHDCADV